MKYFVFDLDKTLLDNEHLISENNKLSLNKMKCKNFNLIVASGRSLRSINSLLSSFLIDYSKICFNGALVLDSNNNIIMKNTIEKNNEISNIITNIIEFLENEKIIYKFYSYDKEITRCYEDIILLLSEISYERYNKIDIHTISHYYNNFYYNSDICFDLKKINNFITNNEIFKLEVLCKNSSLMKFFGKFQKLSNIFEINVTSPRSFEIYKKNTSKVNGLSKIIDIQNTNNYIISIGDGEADSKLFEVSDLSIAMGNASQLVKNKATIVTKQNTEDGVSYAIKNYILGEKQ